MKHNKYRFSWVLVDELAVGPAPRKNRHLVQLEHAGIKSILSLCKKEEAEIPDLINVKFKTLRVVLPDHKAGRIPNPAEFVEALKALYILKKNGPVFVHCVAAMERSPLLCMAWLVREHNMTPDQALDYMMQIHPGTNPLPEQLNLLNDPIIKTKLH